MQIMVWNGAIYFQSRPIHCWNSPCELVCTSSILLANWGRTSTLTVREACVVFSWEISLLVLCCPSHAMDRRENTRIRLYVLFYWIYIAPRKENYSEALPAQTRENRKDF